MRIKRFIVTFFCLFAAITMSTHSAIAQNSISTNEVNIAVEKLRMAMIRADSVMLDKIASDQLSYGHSGGQLQNKTEFVHSFVSGASVFLNIELTNQTIAVENNVAIVRHILSASTNDKGKGPGSVKLGILLVWVKNNDGELQLFARQAVKLPQ